MKKIPIFHLLGAPFIPGKPISPGALALYDFLKYYANLKQWEMPLEIIIHVVLSHVSFSKAKFERARTELIQRGLISIKNGDKGHVTQYWINGILQEESGEFSEPTSEWGSKPTSECGSKPASKNQTMSSAQESNNVIIASPSHNPIYINEKNKKIKTKKKDNNTETKGILSLHELEDSILADDVFLKGIEEALAAENLVMKNGLTIQDYVRQFFNTPIVKQKGARNMKECKTHFKNWICKALKYNYYDERESTTSTDRSLAAARAVIERNLRSE